MNSRIKSVVNSRVFAGLLIVLFIFIFLWVYDLTKGDANGIVAGIQIQPIILSLSVFSGIILVLLAVIGKSKLAQNSLLAIFSVLITFFILEWFCGKWLAFQQANQPKIEGPKHSFIPDDNLGYKPEPNQTIAAVKTINGDEIYNISFQTDANSLRKVELNNVYADKFAQFYGCSMTFGEGVNSHQTIPHLFAQKDSSYQAYNFAFSGYGPSQMLARLQTNQPTSIVEENSGFGVYIYIPDHVNRVVNTYTNYSYNRGNVPKYEIQTGELVRAGTYARNSKFRNLIFDLMARSKILKVFNVGYPFKISEADYELTAEIFVASAKEFKAKFQSDRFFIVIYPSNGDNTVMVDLLRRKGLKVLDYTNLFDPSEEGLSIPNDEHPTERANQLLVNKLYQDINALD